MMENWVKGEALGTERNRWTSEQSIKEIYKGC